MASQQEQLGNETVADAPAAESPATAGQWDALNLDRLAQQARDQALVLRDKIQENPLAIAGVAAGVITLLALARSIRRARRQQRIVTSVLAVAGLARALTPLLHSDDKQKAIKAAQKLGTRLARAERLKDVKPALRDNAGPLLNLLLPFAIRRISRRWL